MLGIVGGGIGASPDVVIVAMVEGVIIRIGDADSHGADSAVVVGVGVGRVV
nr:hypothetical protein [Tanacetum cinerariifolium]